MPTLTEEQLEQYKGLRLKPEDIDFGDKRYGRVKKAENKILKDYFEEGLPYYFAMLHHVEGRSLGSIAKEYGLYMQDIHTVFKTYNIPSRTRKEAIAEKWKDPEFRKRQAETSSKALKGKKRKPKVMARKKWKPQKFGGGDENHYAAAPKIGKKPPSFLEAYDMVVLEAESNEELVDLISRKTGKKRKSVSNLLKKYLK